MTSTLTKISRQYLSDHTPTRQYNSNPLNYLPTTLPQPSFKLYYSFSSGSKLLILFLLLIQLIVGALGGPTPCENPKALGHCTCSMKESLEYINNAAVVSRSILQRAPDAVSQRIKNFQCRQYDQLPPALVIKWADVDDAYRMTMTRRRRVRSHGSIPFKGHFKRNVLRGQGQGDPDPLPPMKSIRLYKNADIGRLSRRQRQVPLGYPSNELFGEVIPKLPPKSSQHRYVPLGGQVTLPCSGEEEIVEETLGLERKFQWTHSSGRPVSAGEMSVDKSSGELTLKAVSLSDTDVYNCFISYTNEDSEEPETITHSQQLDVVAEPIAWLKFSVIYSADNCDHDEMTLIQDHLVKWVHTYVCFFCPVRNNSVRCVSNGGDSPGGGDGAYQNVQIRLAISTLGMEHRMTTFQTYSEACPLPCVESLHLKILQIVRNSLEKLFSLEIDIEGSEGQTSVYSPQKESIEGDLALGCPSGFFDNYKLCFPCPAGQYSPNSRPECSTCPLNYYQPTPGSSICFPCPTGYGTIGDGSLAEFDCKIELFTNALRSSTGMTIVLTILGISIPILLAVCLIPYFCPNTLLGRWFSCCSCCGPDPDMDPPKLEQRRGSKDKNDLKGQNGQYDHNGYSRLQTAEVSTDDEDDVEFKPVTDRRMAYENFGESRGGFRVEDKPTTRSVGLGRSMTKNQNRSEPVRPSQQKIPKPPPLPLPLPNYSNFKLHRQSSVNSPTSGPVSQLKSNTSNNSKLHRQKLTKSPTSRPPIPPPLPLPLPKNSKTSNSPKLHRQKPSIIKTINASRPPPPTSKSKSRNTKGVRFTPSTFDPSQVAPKEHRARATPPDREGASRPLSKASKNDSLAQLQQRSAGQGGGGVRSLARQFDHQISTNQMKLNC